MVDSVERGTSGKRKVLGVVALQGIGSLSTLVQVTLFAIVLPRADFDEYAVWVTSALLCVGIAQGVGAERVVVGRRAASDGLHAATALGVVVLAAQLVVALALHSASLVVCSLAMYAWVVYDHQRVVQCVETPRRFVRRDGAILTLQVLSVVLGRLVAGESPWLAAWWWIPALPFWMIASEAWRGRIKPGLVQLLRTDRETMPLFADAVLAGSIMLAVLSLAHSDGPEGAASAARMALTILGPVTVVGLAARRMVYAYVAAGTFSSGFFARWTALVALVFVVCFGLLLFTRTPLYPAVLPGFDALAWSAILGFAVNHATILVTYLPSARLRAMGRANYALASRVIAVTCGVVAIAILAPITTPTDVAWCIAASSLGHAVSLNLGVGLARRLEQPTSAQPT